MKTVICAPAARTGGAIAIVRVSGEGCLAIIDKIFSAKNHKCLTEAKPYTLHYGEIKDRKGNIVDEVLISVFMPPIVTQVRTVRKSAAMAANTSLTASYNCSSRTAAVWPNPGNTLDAPISMVRWI